jgi:hypothetical protein
MDFDHTKFMRMTENKPYEDKVTKVKTNCYYHPGFIFIIKTVRDPFPKIIRAFFPAFILAIFLYRTFYVEAYEDRLANLSICLLTYIAILDQIRSSLPEISTLTFADKYLFAFIFTSLLPVYRESDWIVFYGLSIRKVCLTIHESVMFINVCATIWHYVWATKLLD